MTAEQWAEVAPGYSVSNLGRVRGKSGRILNPSPNSQGYLTFSIGRMSVKVHVLVARHFVPGRFEGSEVRHLDGDPLNCAASNLAWGTHAENVRDQLRHGTHSTANRTHCPKGHEYTTENTRVSNGRRHCKSCDREASRRYYRENREKILQSIKNRRVLSKLAALA